MKKVYKLTVLPIFVLLCNFTLTTCSYNKIPYNAVMYDILYEMRDTTLTDEFFSKVWETHSKAESDSANTSHGYIITNKQQHGKIFANFEPKINYKKQMVLIYAFGPQVDIAEYVFTNAILEDKELIIQFTPRFPRPYTVGITYQFRYFVVILDKIDIDSVQFNYTR